VGRLLGLSLLLAVSCLPVPLVAGAEPLETVLKATVKITNKSSSGTGFLVSGPRGQKGEFPQTILVTAAHVWEQMSGDECRLVLHLPEAESHLWQRTEQKLKIRSEGKPLWVRHRQADVAAIGVDLPEAAARAALPYRCIASEQSICSGAIRPGDQVWIACYPVRLEANSSGFAVLRHGTVASYPLAPVDVYRTFLVDYSTFGGDSGSPVVAKLPDAGRRNGNDIGVLVIGLVSGQHRQTDKVVLPFEERITHHPLGLAIAVPGELIRQTIDRLVQQCKVE